MVWNKREKEKGYLLLELAVTLRRSSKDEEEEGGKIPRSTRHRTPLRWVKRSDLWETIGMVVDSSIAAGDMAIERRRIQVVNR